MFFERQLENIIELFVPGITEPKTVLDMVTLCKDHIKKLNIAQLLPPVKEPQTEDEEQASELTLANDDDKSGMDHFDFRILLDKLTNLEELHLVYKVKSCGMNFEWSMFEMTNRDCESLAKALKSCKTLKVSIALNYIVLIPDILCEKSSRPTSCRNKSPFYVRFFKPSNNRSGIGLKFGTLFCFPAF